MNDPEEFDGEYDDYIEGKLTEHSNESYEEKSDMEYCSPRFGEFNFSEEDSSTETDKEDLVTNDEDNLQFYSDTEGSNEDFDKDVKEHSKIITGQINENQINHNIQKTNTLISEYSKINLLQKETTNNEHGHNEKHLKIDSEYMQPAVFENNLNDQKKNKDQKNSNRADETQISYKELELQVKSLLEASNKHQEKVHAELDGLLMENENYKEEISRLNIILKNNELLLSQYKLKSMALSAQLPFLKSNSFMEQDKEELYFLRNKVKILESKLREHQKELENSDTCKEKIIFLENELERITKEFNELEIFQTEQLRIADGEIISLTEANNTLFKEMHLVMKENEGLKLTKSVIKRIETHYKNISDDIVLPNIEEELNEKIKDFIQNKDSIDDNGVSSLVFETCQTIIPRLAYEIAEEIVINLENNERPNEQLKRSFTKKNASIQVGFPLINGSTIDHSEIGIISSRSELISLRSENSKLKKENQKLKQDLFLLKRINHRTKDQAKINCFNRTKPKQIELINDNQEELVLNGIKWLTSVVNEIDDLEQKYSSIKACKNKPESRRSSAYNSTVASFEDINLDVNERSSKDEVNLDKELIMLREKLVNEGILVGE
ncbi:uncharacterized protein cubi_01454 [Cryptosporidium ubiquitum]|uniref:Uncharacterized protein n=1 Tax=Cryptosporidium ubiquitum TaxID=857276 RepID=A0A1J4MD18_9CRYT|nr:uncharacterized protein cubi_01454 [Cryptosporidium ubiquitum]OII72121.1 hypothetical protein cubi_01454 [Cryptosporidium ubiquitum]